MCGAIRRDEVSIREHNWTNHDCAKRGQERVKDTGQAWELKVTRGCMEAR